MAFNPREQFGSHGQPRRLTTLLILLNLASSKGARDAGSVFPKQPKKLPRRKRPSLTLIFLCCHYNDVLFIICSSIAKQELNLNTLKMLRTFCEFILRPLERVSSTLHRPRVVVEPRVRITCWVKRAKHSRSRKKNDTRIKHQPRSADQ